MKLPQTSDEKLKLAIDILVNGKRGDYANSKNWENGEFVLYQGAGTLLFLLYSPSVSLWAYLPVDKKSPYFAPLVLLLKIKAPRMCKDWLERAELEQHDFRFRRGWASEFSSS